MATLFFGVTGPTLDLRQDLQIADTDAPRIMGYLMSSPYGQVTENVQSEVPDPNWTPAPGQTEADRPLIPDTSWEPGEGQTEADRPMIPDPDWTPLPPETEADRPTITVQEWVTRPATPEETAANYANAILSQLLDATVTHEKAQAAAAAASSVAPIEVVSA